MEEFVTDDNDTVHLMKTHHDTYIYMDHESGYIWQTTDLESCDQKDLVTLEVTEFPTPLEVSEEEEEEVIVKPAKTTKTAGAAKSTTNNKKEVDPNKPKRKPSTKMLAFQAYCKDNRAKVKEEFPEAKLGEQQKTLSEWWKQETEEVHVEYEQMVTE